MADRTLEALELALEMVKAVEAADMFSAADDVPMPGKLRDIHDTIAGALSSLKQRPTQIDSMGLHARLTQEIRSAGSETALAAKMGIKRQSLSDVLNDRREAGPAILHYLKLARCKQMYAYAEPPPKVEPKARSERRQRAWDMQPRIQEGASA